VTEQQGTPSAGVAPSRQAGDDRMPKPIFVLGAAGSGTTLLRLILDSHPNIAIGPETAIMRLVLAHRWVPYHEHGDRWWRRLEATEEEVDRGLRDLYSSFYEHTARRQGKPRWGDKTPLHVWHIDEIARVFDDAVFVAIVRHPAASIASNVSRFRFSVKLAINTWLRMNQVLVHDGAKQDGRTALVRYEDLLADPEGVLHELLDWLEEPWSPAVLQHHRVQTDKGVAELTDGRTRPGDAIDRSRASKWMTLFTDRERKLVRRRVDGWPAFFGYDVDRPDPVEPFTPDGSTRRYVLTARELQARREAFAGRLDLSRPEPPLRDQPFRPPPPQLERAKTSRKRRLAAVRSLIPVPVKRGLLHLAQLAGMRARPARARS
jgi:hypothetical protein